MKTTTATFIARTIWGSLLLSTTVLAAPLTVSLSPGGHVGMTMGETKSFATSATGGSCGSSYKFSMTATPKHGSMNMPTNFKTTGQFNFTHESTMHGKMGSAKESITVTVTCGNETASTTVQVSDSSATCSTITTGAVILDNTAIPGFHAIKTNLAFFPGCDKGATTIENGYGGNSINVANYHTLSRDTTVEPHNLVLQIGAEQNNVADGNFGTEDQLNYFASGKHLFELNRLRSTADWLSANVSTLLTPAGTYGSISFPQFLDNIVNNRTMYGIVRVKVGLEKGQCVGTSCTMNSLGQSVTAANLYGFCQAGNTAGECACAPGQTSSANHFESLAKNTSICGYSLPATAKIKVKGTLLWDFVDHLTGAPISLAELPFAPKELYFKVEIPVSVNGSHDADNNGTMDNMDKIKAITNAKAAGVLTPAIGYSDIPQSSIDSYFYETGNNLSGDFTALNNPSKYHLLMASGYADGWAEAFTKLQLTAATWTTLPPAGCLQSDGVSACSKFTVPDGASGILTANDIRNEQFEDIPVYLYSGGLVDMHDHVNISGLVYVPQALELEAKNSTTRQYVNGGIVVRDGFYIEASNSSIVVISADPTSYSTAKIATQGSGTPPLSFVAGGPGAASEPPPPSDATYCFGCGGLEFSSGSSSNSNNSSGGVGQTRWVEILPQ